ncbi:hypothetical protein [Vibrio furnissii]|uniref:hypothetical protein n=1 Tax=Vibrio furnissii TaxID=29494 RepID=UPI001EEB0816|nr:hypothetical protein [Vibrio furnissii]MCG6268288.1 hypothetical protein [Vibrio furnissii]
MTYQQWVDKVGYDKACQVLGHPVSTLRMWYSMQRFPRPPQMVSILDKTAGVIDVEQWTRAFADRKKAAGEATAC